VQKDNKKDNIKDNNKIEEEVPETRIRHLDKRVYELAKQFLKSQYGTHYAHLGEFLSFSIKHTLECVYGINVDEHSLKPIVVRKNISDPKHYHRRNVIIKICESLLTWPEDSFDKKSIRGEVIRVYEEVMGLPPSRWTIDRNLEYLIDRGALIRNQYSGNLRINHKRLKQIIDNLKNRV